MADAATPTALTVDFDMASAKLEFDLTKGGLPHTQMRVLKDNGTEFAFFHLDVGNAPLPAQLRFGVNFKAEVTLKTPFDINGLAKWRFGFVQVAKLARLNFTFLGRTPKEGHIAIDLLPSVNTQYTLDKTDQTPFPFCMKPVNFEVDNTIFCATGDHPNIVMHRWLRNHKTGHYNALYKVEHELDLISTFLGIAPSGRFVNFANVEWSTRYDADFQIVDGKVVARGRRGGVKVSDPKQGAHPLAPFNLSPPTANQVAAPAFKAGFLPGSKARFDGLFYPPSTPDNFIFDIKTVAQD